ncbi:hypothetical protein PIROE2DRAFT_9474 [Piromyces sp. E2]|nr:hypothetical protein PIROE2DRAFT_9474 [Piromyces sp. E2]|eukprot:OUM63874.1 hypothetical protein PIROE2DRAFT_9474 [Piromyces sp. E2]
MKISSNKRKYKNKKYALALLKTFVEYLLTTDHHWPETIGITVLKKDAVFVRNGIYDNLPDLSW